MCTGIAFQLVDDVLDYASPSDTFGGAPEMGELMGRKFERLGDVELACRLVHDSAGVQRTREADQAKEVLLHLPESEARQALPRQECIIGPDEVVIQGCPHSLSTVTPPTSFNAVPRILDALAAICVNGLQRLSSKLRNMIFTRTLPKIRRRLNRLGDYFTIWLSVLEERMQEEDWAQLPSFDEPHPIQLHRNLDIAMRVLSDSLPGPGRIGFTTDDYWGLVTSSRGIGTGRLVDVVWGILIHQRSTDPLQSSSGEGLVPTKVVGNPKSEQSTVTQQNVKSTSVPSRSGPSSANMGVGTTMVLLIVSAVLCLGWNIAVKLNDLLAKALEPRSKSEAQDIMRRRPRHRWRTRVPSRSIADAGSAARVEEKTKKLFMAKISELLYEGWKKREYTIMHRLDDLRDL
ncbi:hypothetical protein BDN72DRAFT_905635 [Pluteus cervinus]|uniref:Uncharacterized protein n=1 Tax=Pluteus cervinus TaxID=181527 RepID=A0ACD3A2Q2_9AGAR|nr:hypothetical protein BDN72DRAFT_905635 [Pluteus cervinus]